MIDVDEAQRIVLVHARALPTEDVPIRDALYRTLAGDLRCDVDNPPLVIK
jgi:molybdopterin biosynthesis enzyme